MVSKFELSIDVNYVKSWGIIEAVREFFQNSYDEEAQNSENESFFEYNEQSECLRIGNKLSVLKSETLLLGCTSKDSDEDTIGKFGEGYKIATVVALRTGHNVTIYNCGAREVWGTKLVKSRKYNGRLVPTFFIHTGSDYTAFINHTNFTTNNNLIIEISNITASEYQKILESNLNLRNPIQESLETTFGDILLDKEMAGQVYVSGLYVYTNNQMSYGYNVKPCYLPLDRDRKTVSSFDLQWVTTKMWLQAVMEKDVDLNKFMDMLETNESDIYYLDTIFHNNMPASAMSKEDVAVGIYQKFIEKYGKVIPVDSEFQRRKLKLADNEVAYVSSRLLSVLNHYTGDDKVTVKEETYYQRYKKLLDDLREFMNDEQKAECDYLLEVTEDILGGDD